jgi:uncharacterized protein (TIGR02246 family)
MTREQLERFFHERQQAWARHDAEALTRDHAEDGTLMTPMLGSVRGRDQIGATYRMLFRAFSEQEFSFDPILVDGNRVAQPITVGLAHTGEFMGMAPTGRRAQVQGVFLYDMASDGLIGHEHRVYDFTSLLIQIGALRAKPGR